MYPLTNKQRALAEANVKLVYFVAHQMRNTRKLPFDFDDTVGYGMLGLLQAAQAYDETRGKFASFAITVIRNHIKKAAKHAQEERRGGGAVTLSLDAPGLEMTIGSAEDGIERTVRAEAIEGVIRHAKLTTREKRVLEIVRDSGTYKDVAKALNITLTTANTAIWELRVKLQKQREEEESD